jgi:cullin 3
MENTGLDFMVNENRVDDMSRLYKIFGLVPDGLPALKRELKVAVEYRGNQINQLVEDDDLQGPEQETKQTQDKSSSAIKWVQGVLDLRDQFTSLLRGPFESDPAIEESIGEVCACTCIFYSVAHQAQAFESFINRNSRGPEFISLFIDENLRKGMKGVRSAFQSEHQTNDDTVDGS